LFSLQFVVMGNLGADAAVLCDVIGDRAGEDCFPDRVPAAGVCPAAHDKHGVLVAVRGIEFVQVVRIRSADRGIGIKTMTGKGFGGAPLLPGSSEAAQGGGVAAAVAGEVTIARKK
jgi:hypothetical protein